VPGRAWTASNKRPRGGDAHDVTGRLTDHTGVVLGLLHTAAGLALPALAPHLAGLLAAAVLNGAGTVSGPHRPLRVASSVAGRQTIPMSPRAIDR
jgi:hypothetical protein